MLVLDDASDDFKELRDVIGAGVGILCYDLGLGPLELKKVHDRLSV